MVTNPTESVLAVVAEFGADLQAAAKNAIDAVRETAATSQESYALAPPQTEQVNPWLKYAPISPASLGLGAVVRATVHGETRIAVKIDLEVTANWRTVPDRSRSLGIGPGRRPHRGRGTAPRHRRPYLVGAATSSWHHQ